jgi:hypothetical protein
MRTLLLFARAQMTTPATVDDMVKFYREALGTSVVQEVDAKTGEILLTAGEQDHFQLVTITAKPSGCLVKIEHTQQFTLTPRVFTGNELRVKRLLDEITQRYQNAQGIVYTMTQQAILPKSDAQAETPAALVWTVNVKRPAQLQVTATVKDVLALSLTTEKDTLRVHRQAGKDVVRPLTGDITLDVVPEMEDDPVAKLFFGVNLVNEHLDYLDVQEIPGVPSYQRAKIVLTYPDWDEILYLDVDLQQKVILRAETVVKDHGTDSTVVRTYIKTKLPMNK